MSVTMNTAIIPYLLGLLLIGGVILPGSAQESAGSRSEPSFTNHLPLTGRVTDGERKLEKCTITVYRGNELVEQVSTDRAGKFRVGVELGDLHTVEFTAEGYMHKRVVVDTRADLPDEPLQFAPIMLDVSLIDRDRYEGADTDILDMPFAMVQFDEKSRSFVQDHDYSANMMRTHGALLLMAGRVGKN